jgi:hypothetical protein
MNWLQAVPVRRADSDRRPLVSSRLALAAISLLGGGAVLAGAWPATASTRAACVPGTKTLRGFPVHVFCGPATATVVVKGHPLVFKNGSCARYPNGAFGVDIGTAELDPTTTRYKFFELAVLATRDGTYPSRKRGPAEVEWHVPGKRTILFPTVVRIAGKMTRGTFAGKLEDGTPVSGSFRC